MRTNILEQYLFDACIINESIYDFYALLESRLDFIKSKYSGAYDSVIDRIANEVDPTPNKKYTEWLVNQHRKGEDVFDSSVKKNLEHFSQAKSTVHDTNINNHSLSSMSDVAHLVKTEPKIQRKGELEKQYDKDGVMGFKIPDKDTSIQFYGPGRQFSTRWCHAADSIHNAFDTYEGGKYTMHFPNGHFLGFHHASMQTKDPDNYEIDFEHDNRYSPYNEHISKFIAKTAKDQGIENHLGKTRFPISEDDSDFQDAWKKMQDLRAPTRHYIFFHENFHHYKLNDEQFAHVMEENKYNLDQVQKNRHLTPEQMHAATNGFTRIHATLVSNPGLKGDQFEKVYHIVKSNAYSDPTSPEYDPKARLLMLRLAENRNMTPAVADDIINTYHNVIKNGKPHRFDNTKDIVSNLVSSRRYKFSDDQLEHLDRIARENEEYNYSHEVARGQKVPETIRKSSLNHFAKQIMIGTMHPSEYKEFIAHNEVHPNELTSLVNVANKTNSYYKNKYQAALLETPSLTQEHKDSILKNARTAFTASGDLVSSPRLTKNEAASLYTPIDRPHELRPFFSRRDVTGQDATKLLEKIDSKKQFYSPTELNDAGYFKLRNLPNEVLTNPDHANFIIDAMPAKMGKDALTNVIKNVDPVNHWSDNLKSIIDHPSFNMDHAKMILDKYHETAKPKYLDALLENPRTPPSIKTQASLANIERIKRETENRVHRDTYDDDDIPF